MIRQFLSDASGAGMTEYALLLSLIALVVALSLPALTTAISGVFTEPQLMDGLNG
jgi:Flp pilus assembly pilin Flp